MPAGLCGVVGLKPTFGRVSNSGWVLTSVGFFFPKNHMGIYIDGISVFDTLWVYVPCKHLHT